jgi:hypothetical protein
VTDLDDIQVGRLLSLRELLVLFGSSGTAAFLAACTPSALRSLAPISSPTTAAVRSPGTVRQGRENGPG